MLEDYTSVLNTGKQIVVGLSRVPDGKIKTPDGHPANCEVAVYKVPEPLISDRMIYHIIDVGSTGAALPQEFIEFVNILGDVNKPLLQIYQTPNEESIKNNCIIVAYELLASPHSKSRHIIFANKLKTTVDNLEEIINQINASKNFLM